MTKRQRSILRNMGFGKILKLNLQKITSKLGHYVINKLDVKKMQIDLPRKRHIKVDKESIENLLGIPNDGLSISSLKKTDRDPLVQQWKDRYPGLGISPAQIVKKIKENAYDNEKIFEIDFLMLFVTTMIKCSNNGRCMYKLLDRLPMHANFIHFDWCEYVIDKIKTSKLEWKNDNNDSFFTGPITVLTVRSYIFSK